MASSTNNDASPPASPQPPSPSGRDRRRPTFTNLPDLRLPTITEGVPARSVPDVLTTMQANGREGPQMDRIKVPRSSLPDINNQIHPDTYLDAEQVSKFHSNTGYVSSNPNSLDQLDGEEGLHPRHARMGRRSGSIPSLNGSATKMSRATSKTSLMNRRLSAFNVHSQRLTENQRKTMANYTSINYAPNHSQVFTEWLRNHQSSGSWERWFLMILIGIVIGLVASLLKQLLQALDNVKWDKAKEFTGELSSLKWAYLWLAGISSLFVIASSLLVVFVHPPACGSGVPEVISFLNGVIVHGTLSVKNLVVKFLANVLAVSSGLPCAIQGPIIAMGAVVGCGLGQFESKTFNFSPKMFAHFRNPEDRRSFTTAGVAAGVAAAFNAPIGGLLFAMEDLSTFWSRTLSWQTFFCSGIAAATANLFNTAFKGFVYDGHFGLFSLTVTEPLTMNVVIFLPAIVMGLIGGIMGALFTRLNALIVTVRKKIIKKISNKTIKGLSRTFECVILVLIMSAIVVFLPLAFECKPIDGLSGKASSIVQSCIGNETFETEAYVCGKVNISGIEHETYSEVATLMMRSGTAFLGRLTRRNIHRVYSYESLGSIFVCWLFMACWTAGSAIAGGLFVPLLISGALAGRALGLGCLDLYCYASGHRGDAVFSCLPTDQYWEWLDPGAIAILGAGSLLGGVTRLTLAITVIIVEMSQDIDIVVPVLVANFVAKLVADCLSKPLYKYQLDSKSLPYLDPNMTIVIHGQVKNLEAYSAEDVMVSDVKTIKAIESISKLAGLLILTEHGAFPVVKYEKETNTDQLIGIITRTELYVILRSDQVYNCEIEDTVIRPDIEYAELSVDYITDLSACQERVRMYCKFQQYKRIYIDLNHLINRSVPKVDKSYSLHRTYSLFRTLGTRHLVVIDHSNTVAGIITRKDLMNYNVTTRILGIEERLNQESDSEDSEAESEKVLPAITTRVPPNGAGIPKMDNESDVTDLPSMDPRSQAFTSAELPLNTIIDETNL